MREKLDFRLTTEEKMGGQSLSKQASRDNALSLIRIIAALQVMLGHMFEHLQLPANPVLVDATYFFRGVPIFFALSGYLIWFSIARSKSYKDYLRKRFWRIYPELWVAVAIEIIVLVCLYRGWEIKSLIAFVFGQATIFQFWTPGSLKGYGVGTPNGALWTIGVMIQFYIIAWFVYKLLKNKKIYIWIIGFALSFLISWLAGTILNDAGIIGKIYSQTVIKYFWLFYLGAFVAEFKELLLPKIQKFWWVLLLLAGLFFWTKIDLYSGYYLLWSTFLVTGLIGFAYRFPKLQIKTDVSYGVFLYHMTIVNVFVTFGWIKNWGLAAICALIVIAIAFLSTKTVGAWSSRIKAIKS